MQPSPDERIAFECAVVPAAQRATLGCYYALQSIGKLDEARAELERLRKVRGAPNAYATFALRDALVKGDLAAARGAYDSLLPGERTLSAMSAIEGTPKDPCALRARLLSAAAESQDSPGTLPALLLTLGDDPATEFEGIGARIAAQDRKAPALAWQRRAVLEHRAVRRVGERHRALRLLRRPAREWHDRHRGERLRARARSARADDDACPSASHPQARRTRARAGPRARRLAGRPELSLQLEQATSSRRRPAAKSISIPTESSDVGIDTPIFLPSDAVARAEIELRMPQSLKPALWVHPILGKAAGVSCHEGAASRRVLKWSLSGHNARRMEKACRAPSAKSAS